MNGDFVMLDPRTRVTESGFIKSRHLTTGSCAARCCWNLRRVKRGETKLGRKVYLMFSVYEEVSHGVGWSACGR